MSDRNGCSYTLGLTSTALVGVLANLMEKGKLHDQLLDTLKSTRQIIVQQTSEHYYAQLLEQCNNNYTKECHDIMNGILPCEHCDAVIEVVDDHCGDDMNIVDEGHEVEDSANVDRYLGVVIRDLSGKEPTSREKNQFADAINSETATTDKIQQMFNIPTQRLNKYARHVRNQGSYDEIAPQTIGNNIICKQ